MYPVASREGSSASNAVNPIVAITSVATPCVKSFPTSVAVWWREVRSAVGAPCLLQLSSMCPVISCTPFMTSGATSVAFSNAPEDACASRTADGFDSGDTAASVTSLATWLRFELSPAPENWNTGLFGTTLLPSDIKKEGGTDPVPGGVIAVIFVSEATTTSVADWSPK